MSYKSAPRRVLFHHKIICITAILFLFAVGTNIRYSITVDNLSIHELKTPHQTFKERLKLENDKPREEARTIMGIFCTKEDFEYRQIFRELFDAHPNVCNVDTALLGKKKDDCKLVYTFVIGGNNDPNAPTKIYQNTSIHNITLSLSQCNTCTDADKNYNDMTILNITENMEEGKSLTWFYYASTYLTNSLDADYIGKMDTDTLLYLDKYFNDFAPNSLSPSPHNRNTMAGHFVPYIQTTSKWNKLNKTERQLLTYFINQYSDIKIYGAGQLYIFSTDLAEKMVTFAQEKEHSALMFYGQQPRSGLKNWTFTDFEIYKEDIDMGSMAFLSLAKSSRENAKIILVRKVNQFWIHPIKKHWGCEMWKEKWDEEIEKVRKQFNITTFRNSTNACTENVANNSSVVVAPGIKVNTLSDVATLHNIQNESSLATDKEHYFAQQNSWWDTLETGWGTPPEPWMLDLCSEVVDHFNVFPSFKEMDPRRLNNLPLFPTNDAAHAVSERKPKLCYTFY